MTDTLPNSTFDSIKQDALELAKRRFLKSQLATLFDAIQAEGCQPAEFCGGKAGKKGSRKRES